MTAFSEGVPVTRFGIDLASYQHPNREPIDYAAVAGAGVTWAAVKITEGADYVNPYAGEDVAGLIAAGIEVVVYHFAQPQRVEAASAAAYFVANLPVGAEGYRRCIDLEVGDALGWPLLAQYCDHFRAHCGADLLYVNRSYRDGMTAGGWAWGGDWWLAWPDHQELDDGLFAVQYGQADVAGIPAPVDVNVVRDTDQPAPAPAPTPSPAPAPTPNPLEGIDMTSLILLTDDNAPANHYAWNTETGAVKPLGNADTITASVANLAAAGVPSAHVSTDLIHALGG